MPHFLIFCIRYSIYKFIKEGLVKKMKIKDPNLTNNEYAKACIALQKYENLLSTTEAFKLGTIFRDLRSSYEETETVKK